MKMKNPQLYRIVQALIWIGEGESVDDLRESVLAAFGKYMSDAAEVIRVMKKLRSLAELQLLVDSFSEK